VAAAAACGQETGVTSSVRLFVRTLWRTQRAAMLAVGALSLALTLTEGVGLLLLIPMLRVAGVSLGDPAADRIASAVDGALRAVGLAPTLVSVLAVVVGLVAARAALQLWLARCQAALEIGVVSSLRQRLFAAIVELPWARFAGERPAALVHAMGPQLDDVQSALIMLLDAAALSTAVVAAGAVALAVSPLLTVVVAVAGVLLLATARALRAPGRSEGERLIDAASALFARVSELLGSMKMVHAHGAEPQALAAVANDTHAWARLAQLYTLRRAQVNFAVAVLGVIMLAMLVWVSVAVAHLAPATLLLLLLVYARLVPRLAELQSLSSHIAQAMAAFDSVSALLARCDAGRAAADGSRAGVSGPRAGTAPAIEVCGITVRYPTSDRDTLRNCSATFAAGALTTVVGPTGVGKTTLGDALLGLLEVAAGQVLIDGVTLTASWGAQWRARIGYLAQDPMLFHGTIRENLKFARPDVSDAELRAALRDAACDFVELLPHGLDTAIGDRGVLLSGGERQRLALARALVRRPDLLMLDEATSALDADTEARILATLGALRGRCTVVFCTHREAVCAAADHVVELRANGA